VDHSSKYKLLKQVGNGSFGVVYKAVNKDTGEVVAIKEVRFVSLCLGRCSSWRRLTWRVETMILPRFSRRSQY
jgi:hypothetical protein